MALSDEVERLRASGASITEEELERRLDVLRKKMAESGGFNETGSAVFRCIACNRALPEQAKWKLDRDEAQFMAHRDVRQVRSLARSHARRRGPVSSPLVRVRLKIIRNASITNVGKSESCMVYQLRMIFKRTRN